MAPRRRRSGVLHRIRLWMAVAALVVLVALSPAGLWSDWGWEAILPVIAAWGLAGGLAGRGWRAQASADTPASADPPADAPPDDAPDDAPATAGAAAPPPATPFALLALLLPVGMGGALLTLLFWTRASLGVPGVMLGDMGLKLGALLGGWPWPALLLAGLVGLAAPRVTGQRGGAAGRAPAAGRTPAVGPALLGVALVAGTLGWLGHLPVTEAIRTSDSPRAEALRQALVEPLATRPGLAALGIVGAPRQLEVQPNGLLLVAGEGDTLSVTGRNFPGTRSDLSRPAQGTTVRIADPAVAEAAPTADHTGWTLRALAPGTTGVEVRVGGNSRWIGVRVLPSGDLPAALDVTDQVDLHIDPPRDPPPGDGPGGGPGRASGGGAGGGSGGGFALRQVVRATNHTDVALVGPLHLVIGLAADSEPVLVGTSRVSDPTVLAAFGAAPDDATPDDTTPRVSTVELFPGEAAHRPRVPVLPPGATHRIELLVVAPLDPTTPGVELRVFASPRLR